MSPSSKTVSTICKIYDRREKRSECYEFVCYQVSNLHPIIRTGILLLSAVFDFQAWLLSFASGKDRTESTLRFWQNSKISLLGDYVYFYESLVLVFIFENDETYDAKA